MASLHRPDRRKSRGWFQREFRKPVHLFAAHQSPASVRVWMRLANMCIVSSLADGMNLVAKEYVAAHTDGDGVLILSEFAGAARELPDALIVNPYHIEEFANAIHRAVVMPELERRERMGRMRERVATFNVYRWARDLIQWTARAGNVTRGIESTAAT